jgi:putative transposase
MIDIVACLHCTCPHLTMTTVRQMSCIILALLAMTGRVTMLGLSRWTGQGGSYRTVQRFFYTVIPWGMVFWTFFRHHLFDPQDRYLLGGDECVVTKAGKKTYGLDRFFSSLYGKPVPGLSFFILSFISTQKRRSYPMRVAQMVRSEAEKATTPDQKASHKKVQGKPRSKQGKPGRPKGSKNKDKTIVALSPELQRIQAMIQNLLTLTGTRIPLSHLVLDGHFGNHPSLQMARGCGLHLIAKLRHDAALYFPYEGPYAGRGPRRKYGSKLEYRNISLRYLKQSSVQDNIQTDIYQAQMLHKEFAQPLNIVIIVKTNQKSHKRAHAVLFSSDLELDSDQLINDDSLRFQIEFNFRDAKQYWGLEDFMNVQQRAVHNAANLSLFMVNVAHVLLRPFRKAHPHFGVLDLKAYCRGQKYVAEILKFLPENPEPIIMEQRGVQIFGIGSIHGAVPVFNSP